MIQNFPLYEDLKQEANGKQTKDWGRICLIINNLTDPTHLEILFALIYHHSLLENREPSLLPYDSKLLAKDRAPKFEVGELPPILAEIIAVFVSRLID